MKRRLKPKQRFAVLERDAFTCQYCGRRPPEVVLQVDHIHPHSRGGSDDPLNLITSCRECNVGKRDRVLEDVGALLDEALDTAHDMGGLLAEMCRRDFDAAVLVLEGLTQPLGYGEKSFHDPSHGEMVWAGPGWRPEIAAQFALGFEENVVRVRC